MAVVSGDDREVIGLAAGSFESHHARTVFPSEIVPVSIFLSVSDPSYEIAIGLALAAIGIWDGGLSPMSWFLPLVYTC